MMTKKALEAKLELIELDIKAAEELYQRMKLLSDLQIDEARNEYERQKSEAKKQLADARRKLEIARNRKRMFIKNHYG